MNQEEIVSRGIQATRILEDQSIMSFFDEQLNLIKDSMFNTNPTEEKERDRLYFQHKGVVDFLGILESYKDAATTIITALEAENNEKSD